MFSAHHKVKSLLCQVSTIPWCSAPRALYSKEADISCGLWTWGPKQVLWHNIYFSWLFCYRDMEFGATLGYKGTCVKINLKQDKDRACEISQWGAYCHVWRPEINLQVLYGRRRELTHTHSHNTQINKQNLKWTARLYFLCYRKSSVIRKKMDVRCNIICKNK